MCWISYTACDERVLIDIQMMCDECMYLKLYGRYFVLKGQTDNRCGRFGQSCVTEHMKFACTRELVSEDKKTETCEPSPVFLVFLLTFSKQRKGHKDLFFFYCLLKGNRLII